MSVTIPVVEIFPAIQGEGPLIGRQTIFVRTGLCDYRCVWCDTMYAVDAPKYAKEWRAMTPGEIMEEVVTQSRGLACLITLSGGNPAIHAHLGDLISMAQTAGYTVACETQGSHVAGWFGHLDHLILSPKPPSSGNRTAFDLVDACLQAVAPMVAVDCKIVVGTDEDYDYARVMGDLFERWQRRDGRPVRTYLQPLNTKPHISTTEGLLDSYRHLIERVQRDEWPTAIVLPQLHALVWGNARAR